MQNSSGDKRSDLTKKTLAGVKWSYVSAIVQATLRLGTMSILAHLLLPRDFGLVGLALVFTAFAEQVGTLGVGMALVQRKELEEGHYQAAANFTFACSILVYAALWQLAPFAANFFNEPEIVGLLRAVSFVFAVRSFGVVSENTLLRELRFKELMLAEAFAYAFGYATVGITMAMNGYGPWSLVGAVIAERCIKVILVQRMSPRFPKLRLYLRETKELLAKGLGFMLGRVLNFGAIQGDNLVVGRLLGAGPLGVYGRSYQLMNLPAVYLGGVLNRVLFPAMSAKQDDKASVGSAYLRATEALAVITIPLGFFMFIVAEEIVLVLYGTQWTQVIPLISILAFGVFFRTAYKNADAVNRGMGAVYRRAIRQAIYALSVLGGTALGSRWGLEGVALGVLFAVSTNYILMSALSLELLEIRAATFFRAHTSGLWMGLVVLVCTYPVASVVRDYQSLSIVTLASSGAVAAIAACFAFLVPAPGCGTHLAGLTKRSLPLQRFGKAGNALEKRLTSISQRNSTKAEPQ